MAQPYNIRVPLVLPSEVSKCVERADNARVVSAGRGSEQAQKILRGKEQ